MSVLTFDVETSTHSKGNWNDSRNNLVCLSWCGDDGELHYHRLDSGQLPKQFLDAFDKATCLVGFNIKFDLHCVLRYGAVLTSQRVYDIQLLEFLLSGQKNAYPSLDDTARKYLNDVKKDAVAEYWAKGIQTVDIPPEILEEYCRYDVHLTHALYKKMVLPEGLRKLFSLSCQDLLVLLEMERNGLKFNREKSLDLAAELEQQIESIQKKYFNLHGIDDFNWASPKQLSALLFGGTIETTVRVPAGTFKSGAQKGQVKFKKEIVEHQFNRRYEPISKTPSGAYSTDDDTLMKLTGDDDFIKDFQTMRKLSKEVSTYLRGLPAKQEDGHYALDRIYTQFNQCVTDTGRLSSTNPNVQNLSDTALSCMESRYE